MEATIAFRSVSFKLLPVAGDGWDVIVVGELRGGRKSEDELLVTAAASPLAIQEVSSNFASAVHIPAEAGEATAVRLTQRKSTGGWDGAELVMRLRWRPPARQSEESQRGALEAPCLVLPDMLPRVAETRSSLGLPPPRHLPRLFFEDELPASLNAGGVAVNDEQGHATPELLQTVIFPSTPGAPDFNDVVIASSPAPGDPAQFRRSYEYLQPLLSEVGEMLGPDLAVRPVVCLTDSAATFPVMGAYCPLAPADAGAERSNTGKPVNAIRLLAQAWLGGGMRLWGNNASELALAIGGGLGLFWLQEAGYDAHLERMLDEMTRKVQEAEASRDWRQADIVRAIELGVFRGLTHRAFPAALRSFIQGSWGRYVLQESLIDLLRRHGIAVPHVFA